MIAQTAMSASEEQPAAATAAAGLQLIQAIVRHDLPAVQAALRAEPDALDYHGFTALHAAALADWGAVVPLLLEAGECTALRCALPAAGVSCPQEGPCALSLLHRRRR